MALGELVRLQRVTVSGERGVKAEREAVVSSVLFDDGFAYFGPRPLLYFSDSPRSVDIWGVLIVLILAEVFCIEQRRVVT